MFYSLVMVYGDSIIIRKCSGGTAFLARGGYSAHEGIMFGGCVRYSQGYQSHSDTRNVVAPAGT